MRPAIVCALLLLAVPLASASTYTVTSNADSGWGNLRMGIQLANANPGPDGIKFAIPTRQANVVRPLSPLPVLTDDATTINGDAGRDGKPDVFIDGELAGAASGLAISGAQCTVRGLALGNFQNWLIVLGGTGCRVVGCRLGVKLDGAAVNPGWGAVKISGGGGNVIGGTSPADRNIILPGSTNWVTGVYIDSSGNVVSGNYIGLKPNGLEVYGTTGVGVRVRAWYGPAEGNCIGGDTPGASNVFGGLGTGVYLQGATNTPIQGNLLGLAADADTVLPLTRGVLIAGGATGTRVGGTSAGVRNVFAGGVDSYGVSIVPSPGADPTDTIIRGNYFGMNQAGTETRSLGGAAVRVDDPGCSLTVGGATPAAGNYFGSADACAHGVVIGNDAGPITIRNNKFGRLPAGGDVTGLGVGIGIQEGGRATILDNLFTGWLAGVNATGNASQPPQTEVWVFGNLFRNCTRAVAITGAATGHLGNLGNTLATDDGGNTFKPSNELHIQNTTSENLKAEGNDFTTTVSAAIETKIFDQLDCPGAGRVDYVPLQGGIIPTAAGRASLTVTGAAVTPTAQGAEIVFGLSAPAQVTIEVLNLAGRPVAVLLPCPAERGLNRVTWNGLSAEGTPVPGGLYLVRLTAQGESGGQASALTQVRTER